MYKPFPRWTRKVKIKNENKLYIKKNISYEEKKGIDEKKNEKKKI